jgi:acyl carrier protein
VGNGDAGDSVTAAVLETVRQTYLDLHHHAPHAAIGPATTLDRDLEFDSLARVELVLRLERSFAVRMPDAVLESAETCGDLVRLLRSAGPTRVPAPPTAAAAPEAEAALAIPESAQTLTEALDWHAQRHPERLHLRHVVDPLETGDGEPLTYGALQARARRLAAGIQALGLGGGRSVALMLPTGLDYFAAYFGVLLAGCVPVPIYPPFRASQVEEHVRRHAGILDNAQAVLMITVPQARSVAQLLSARLRTLRQVRTVAELEATTSSWTPIRIAPGDTAFIQYTSGSTGSPKGVVLSHANLLANVRAFRGAVRIDAGDVLVSWLPLYHDMGLIGTWLTSLYYGVRLIVMAPTAFLARPERWLWAIHRYGGTHTVAPNFAYELCLRRIDDAQIHGLDLRRLRVAANGSEQVLPDTLERFAQHFAPYGFDARALLPVYGLAECSVGLLVPSIGRMARIDRVDREAFATQGRAQPAAAGDPHPLRFASCGVPLAGHEARVVDAAGQPVGERVEGRLEFRGPSATAGYHRNPELTRALFHGDWLDSGDRAYVADSEFYVTGRIKDVIIRSGRNLYPDEIEEAVGEVPGIRRGCVAAFGISDPGLGTERLLVLAETREADAQARERLQAAAVAAVVARLGEPPDELLLVPPKAVLKTSSGKLRRAATRDRYLAGRLGEAPRGVARQLLRLAAAAALPWLRNALRRTLETAYAAYAWSVLAVAAVPAWVLVAMAPTPARAWAIARTAARTVLRCAGVVLNVVGAERLPGPGRACVLVVNHASYLDGLVLLAALPGSYRFVAKRELLRSSVARVFLQRLGTLFVERFAVRQSVDDTQRLAAEVAAGESLIVFPEGTFTAAVALRPFHLGAFAVAAQTGAAVVPIAIRGTRALLPAGRWSPRRGSVSVTVLDALAVPQDPVFAAAVALRDQAHAQILAHCGEPEAGPA